MGAFSRYPYPQVRVRVHTGMGTGGPKFTYGLPVMNPKWETEGRPGLGLVHKRPCQQLGFGLAGWQGGTRLLGRCWMAFQRA